MLYFGSSSGKGCNFPNSLDFEVTFVVDKMPLKLGSVFSFNEPAVDGSCTESLAVKITRQQFTKIWQAKKVELRMAAIKIALKKSHLEAFRRFAKQINP